jgi:hypothetical protein
MSRSIGGGNCADASRIHKFHQKNYADFQPIVLAMIGTAV